MGNSASVVNGVRTLKFPEMTTLLSVDSVTGPFDVIAVVETTDLDTLIQWVTDQIQGLGGVERTTTCVS